MSYIIGKHCYTAYKEVNLNIIDNVPGEDFMLEEWHDELYEEDDIHSPSPQDLQINQQHHQSNNNYQPLHSVVDDIPFSSLGNTPQDSSKYGTFPDQLD